MPYGYAYSINNKYNLRLCVATLNKKRIRYRIYDEYIVSEALIEKFNDSKYYNEYVGKVFVPRFKREKVSELRHEDVDKRCIVGNGCEFTRSRTKYKLMLSNRKHFEFRRIKKYDWIFDKIFVERKKDFFEFQFGLVYVDDDGKDIEQLSYENKKINNEECDDVCDVIYNEDVVYEEVQHNNLIQQNIETPIDLYEYEMLEYKETFQLNEVFNDMTRNQSIILGLCLLKVSAKATSILMKSSPTYILLERKRITKKIKKILERSIKYGERHINKIKKVIE